MHVLWICPRLPDCHRPGSMAPAARQLTSLRQLGVEITVLQMRGVPVVKYLAAAPKVRALVQDVDLVHAHFGYCGWLARAQRKRPVVVSFMGDDLLGTPKADGRLEWFSQVMVRANKRLARRVQAVIVKSREMADVLEGTSSHVIPNGVDVSVFQPLDRNDARRRLSWPEQQHRILFPGDPGNPRKGFTFASAAVKSAEQLLGAPIQLTPLWGVPPDDVPLLMNACDAMLMTSLIEGSPNVVKEAMACNVPIVATSVGDVADLLESVDGYHICPRNHQAVGKTLANMIVSSGQSRGRDHIGGRVAILDRGLDLASVAQRILDVYDAVIRGQTDQLPSSTKLAEQATQSHSARHIA